MQLKNTPRREDFANGSSWRKPKRRLISLGSFIGQCKKLDPTDFGPRTHFRFSNTTLLYRVVWRILFLWFFVALIFLTALMCPTSDLLASCIPTHAFKSYFCDDAGFYDCNFVSTAMTGCSSTRLGWILDSEEGCSELGGWWCQQSENIISRSSFKIMTTDQVLHWH